VAGEEAAAFGDRSASVGVQSSPIWSPIIR